jgi:hypothetical protein
MLSLVLLSAAIGATPGFLAKTFYPEKFLVSDTEDKTRSAIGTPDRLVLKTQNDLSLKMIILVGVRVSDVFRKIRGDSTQIARPKLELIINYITYRIRYAKYHS